MIPHKIFIALRGLLSFCLSVGAFRAFSQEMPPPSTASPILSGRIMNGVTGEVLAGAAIMAVYEKKSVLADASGQFSLALQNDTATISVSFVGMQSLDTFVHVNNNALVSFWLRSNTGKNLDEVTINGQHEIQKSSQMGMISLPMSQIQSMPKFFGEADIMKTLQTLPGVQQGSEGSTALLVRGGSPDQNLILIDETPIYNPSHLLGIFSSLNPNSFQSVDLYKGAFPARFGGRLSSVVDLQTKDGNMNHFRGNFSIGMVMSQLTLEGPIRKGKTSFIISGRRTYHDLYAGPIIRSQSAKIKDFAFYFYDVNAKIHHKFSDKSYLDLSVNFGGDKFKLRTEENDDGGLNQSKTNTELVWNNLVSSLKYHYSVSAKLFANASLNVSRYQFSSILQNQEIKKGIQNYNYSLGLNSGMLDYIARLDFIYLPNEKHDIRFGLSGTRHTYNPTSHFQKQIADSATLVNDIVNTKTNALEWDGYVEDDWEISSKLKANIGLHANAFTIENKTFISLQPRISARFLLPDDMALKASYVRMNQNIHLLSSNSLSLPTDLWIPATPQILPKKSDQVSMGIARNIFRNKIEFSLEGYYKQMDNVVEYKEGSSYLNAVSANTWEDKVTSGKGYSYGAELFLQKKTGRLTGSFSYTLAWSNRKFADINQGREFAYKYDRRHTVNLVAIYKLRKNIELSGAFVFQSAAPFTIPTGSYEGAYQQGVNSFPPFNQYYPQRNNIRIQANHRLDLGVSFIREKKNGNVRTWNISLYNAYNRRNLFYYQVDGYTGNNVDITGYSILPILPSVSYSLTFK